MGALFNFQIHFKEEIPKIETGKIVDFGTDVGDGTQLKCSWGHPHWMAWYNSWAKLKSQKSLLSPKKESKEHPLLSLIQKTCYCKHMF